jgi:O-antigen/teichoic acid export membrane protein
MTRVVLPAGRRLSLSQLAFLRGTLWVSGGTAILGVSGYAFLTLAALHVTGVDYAALASMYLLMALTGPGLFMPVEQETIRLVSHARALGLGTRDTIRQLAQLSAAILGLGLLVLVVLGPFLVHHVFGGHVGLWIALALSVSGYGGVNLLRGVFAAQGRMRAYGSVVGLDGLSRLVPCVALALAGVAAAVPYGLAVGIGSVAALALAIPLTRLGAPGGRLPWRTLISAVSWLIASWGLAFSLANIAPVIVTAMLPASDSHRAGVFAFVFVLARLPLFLLLAAQPILLPTLSKSSAHRDQVALRRDLRRALLVTGALGALALVATAPVCLWLSGALLHGGPAVSGWTITLLAVGTILAMVVQVLQPALIAVAGHRMVAAAWMLGAVFFAAAFALPVDPIAAATTAQIVAGAVTLAVMAVALSRYLRRAGGPVAPVEVVG